MTSFIELLESYVRFWPYAAVGVIGALLRVLDRNVLKRPVCAVLLVLVAVAGVIGMNASPFTFSGEDYYFQSLIAMAMAIAGLGGYALAATAMLVFKGKAT